MEKIDWSEKFSVGVEKIDKQHKTLIGMTNQLIDTPNVDSNSEAITDLLNRMIQYATTHFVDEERLMAMHSYPDFDAHQQQHVAFMKKTAEFCTVEEGTAVVHDFSDAVLRYLREWWVNHILGSDLKFKPFVAAKE